MLVQPVKYIIVCKPHAAIYLKPFTNKIVLRFYETPAVKTAGSDWRKAKIPIPAAPISGIFATLRQATGYFEILPAQAGKP